MTVPVHSLVFTAPHTCEVVEESLPETPGPREVRIRNRVGLLSPGTELSIFNRTHRGFEVEGHWAGYPFRPGYASVGVVEAVGAEVRGLAPGDRVLNPGPHATRSQQPAAALVRLSDAVVDADAVFLKLLAIAFTPQMLAPLRLGEDALVIGAGLVGNLAAQLCRVAGAHRVLVAERSPARLERAAACGLPDGIDVRQGLVVDQVRERLGGHSPHYVIEAVGSAASLRAALDAVASDGRMLILSSPREKLEVDPYFDIHHRGVQVIGVHEWRRDRRARAPYDPFLEHLVASERVRVAPLLTHRVPFGARVQAAYEGLRDDPDIWMAVLIEYPEAAPA